LRPDVEKAANKLATKKLADRYIGRRGEPPSLTLRRAAGRAQDVNDDDRHNLKWAIQTLRLAVDRAEMAGAALDFLEALLTRDYGLDRGVERPQDQSKLVSPDEDRELYNYLMTKRIYR
jgi:hypothetical protein